MDSSASYIHMVHHLIERCILFQMTREECMQALSKYANIQPIITATVWKELEKENKDFFKAYTMRKEEKISEFEFREVARTLLSDSSSFSSSSNSSSDCW